MSSSADPEESDLGHSALEHYNEAKRFLPPQLRSNPVVFGAKASTLTQELAKANALKNIGIISLDLEGREYSALKGLDLNQYTPKYILAESRNPERMMKIIGDFDYVLYEKISGYDYLWKNSRL